MTGLALVLDMLGNTISGLTAELEQTRETLAAANMMVAQLQQLIAEAASPRDEVAR